MSWQGVKEEFGQLTASKRFFIFCAMLCGFCIAFDYGIVRPVSHSIFLFTYGSHLFPYVWLAIVPFNLLIVGLYNKFLSKIGIQKMFTAIVASIIIINCLAAFFITKIQFFPFFFYIWKEIYVMLLFQQMWSVIHSTIRLQQAKFLYGLIFACGGVGGIIGSIFSGFFAVTIGSSTLLLGSFPILLLLGLSFYFLLKFSSLEEQAAGPSRITNLWQGMTTIRNSKHLMLILAIVVFMQMATTLVYYQFNAALELAVVGQDLRTEYCGRVLGIANILTVVFQIFGAFFLIHLLGLKRSHLAMPLLLAVNAAGSFLFPTFAMVSTAFITIKSFDFSLFGVFKEMLYVPLKQEEKFQAKAIIDVFAYRSSKALASCLILLLQLIGFSEMVVVLSWTSLALLLAWFWIVYRMFPLDMDKALTFSGGKQPELGVSKENEASRKTLDDFI